MNKRNLGVKWAQNQDQAGRQIKVELHHLLIIRTVGPASRIPGLGDTIPRYKTGNIPSDSSSMNGHSHTHADTPPRTSPSSTNNPRNIRNYVYCIESFFGHMKDELEIMKNGKMELVDYARREQMIMNWVEEYNAVRPHCVLHGMSPIEYRIRMMYHNGYRVQ